VKRDEGLYRNGSDLVGGLAKRSTWIDQSTIIFLQQNFRVRFVDLGLSDLRMDEEFLGRQRVIAKGCS
jgi:hypothetical protein